MKITDIKSEKDFNIYKNGKNPAHLFTEVLSYLLTHVNTSSCLPEIDLSNVGNSPTTLKIKPKTKK